MIKNTYEVTIKGVGGHGSRPDLSASPITCFSHFQPFAKDIFSAGRFEIVSVKAGTSGNVIPETLVFQADFFCEKEDDIPRFEEAFVKKAGRFKSMFSCEFLMRKI